ncbi:MAG: pyruvate kinase [Agathobacter sp.]|nr:pyruvate kinase [Agathobacter sp.]
MNTQIYATFGPACGEETILKQMIEAGMTGMRLNLSHTTLPASEEYIRAYRHAAEELGVVPQILIDMQGPELRVGTLAEAVVLEEGAQCCLSGGALALDEEDCSVSRIPVPQAVIQAAQVGDEMLLDDGKILLEVTRSDSESDHTIQGKVIRGGILHGHKSVKLVGKDVHMPALTDHDIDNIKLAKNYGVTALMQPFVRSPEDLRCVRNVLKAHGAEEVQIFAKIENCAGVDNLEQLLPEADVIIIARGDLGNDMPLWELPRVQKQIEAVCKVHNKPYVVVTQMLSSMEQSPVPTRAEVSDIFHAVYHGAWGVMITGESAIGKYPIEAVKYLANVSGEAEEYSVIRQ